LFDNAAFPCTPIHCWFLVFQALRCGYEQYLEHLRTDAQILQIMSQDQLPHGSAAAASVLEQEVIPKLLQVLRGDYNSALANSSPTLNAMLANPYHAGDIHGQVFRECILLFLVGRPFPLRRCLVDCFVAVRAVSKIDNKDTLILSL
jgi:hypothetical protein